MPHSESVRGSSVLVVPGRVFPSLLKTMVAPSLMTCTDVPACRDKVTPGVDGADTGAGDPVGFAAKMNKPLSSDTLRMMLRVNGHWTAGKKRTWGVGWRQFENIYLRLAIAK
jgi:glycosyltransferase involved in cell wall biosynthesis